MNIVQSGQTPHITTPSSKLTALSPGLLFLGMPYGTDAIQFNAHRIYGSIRLAMMFYGFEWLATYSGENSESFDLNSARLHFKGVFGLTQYTMVLRKL
ncbi:Protein CBG24329 [Caenorhabditis briggsae]|uniref:Protein CBG24329 n=1 Tax=Caenorhabditis briggsae TaxID=6238 RepID=A8WKH0_CAEBR|nr:Protein CBG24329 [Caenorhabditis briggsae]CAP20965.2 Protein CBG24329 [Caenorhabditis briggsae]